MPLYFFEAVNKATDEILARVHGDIDTVAYVARKLSLDAETEYAAVLQQVETIGGAVVRNLSALETNGEDVAFLVKKKITAERKALATPAAE